MVVDFFLAGLFLITSPMSFFFKLPKVADFFDRAACFFDFCIFTGILATFMGDIFLALFLASPFFSADLATSCILFEEALFEFSIFGVQGADFLTSNF